MFAMLPFQSLSRIFAVRSRIFSVQSRIFAVRCIPLLLPLVLVLAGSLPSSGDEQTTSSGDTDSSGGTDSSGDTEQLSDAGLPQNDLETAAGHNFYEKHIRPLLIEHCYECHSEENQESMGGLLLDRRSGWIEGGDTAKAVLPGQVDESLLIQAVRYEDEDFQMPPEAALDEDAVALLEQWVRIGAPGPKEDLGETEFSRLGDQEHLSNLAVEHWAFQPVVAHAPPPVDHPTWGDRLIDRFVYDRMQQQGLTPSSPEHPTALLRRLTYDLTGLPPTFAESQAFETRIQIAAKLSDPKLANSKRQRVIAEVVDELIASPAFGEHWGRLWLDLVRYADTDSNYRPDTKTPHYFPFAFTYRDYVIEALNEDKPFDQFIKEQFAADLMGHEPGDPEIAALGFLAVGPHLSRAATESLDDWIDLTTRGLMGLTVACARCHDHKFEPVPTTDYYALRGIFNSVARVKALDATAQPVVPGYEPTPEEAADYRARFQAIRDKVKEAGNAKKKGNNRSVATLIVETEQAQLWTFHPGAPARAMMVTEKKRRPGSFVFLRGEPANRGEDVSRRFLSILDPQHQPFSEDFSGRLELAEKIVAGDNPLTSRVWVNRVWGHLLGSHLVSTPSDFGLQGESPTHPELLDTLATEFVASGWSNKALIRQIVLSQTYQQSSKIRPTMSALDSENRLLWRANRKRLNIEPLRDSMLAVAGQLDRTMRGHPGLLWPDDEGHPAHAFAKMTKRRTIYGFVNRFNLDPNLRSFDFPAPMQSHAHRVESVVATQALFTLNSPFVVQQADALIANDIFQSMSDRQQRIQWLVQQVLGRAASEIEIARFEKFLDFSKQFQAKVKPLPRFREDPWPLMAQALLMSNEFQYVD